jgi:1,5-anhydro-D-fructose reductase (1,5-anhydro-D-mannitol-forming)
MEAVSGMGQGVEDSSMCVFAMPSGVMVQTHESFTHPHGGTGIEFLGTKGSIRATNVMTQRPVGEITLTTDAGSKTVEYSDHDLYVHSMAKFAAALRGEGGPSASGVDGVKSLAVALAVKKAAVNGTREEVDYGGVA